MKPTITTHDHPPASLREKATQVWSEKHPDGRIAATADPSAMLRDAEHEDEAFEILQKLNNCRKGVAK